MNSQNPEKPARPEKTEGKALNKDLAPLLKGWDYEAGTINVRKIRGADGQPKLQMRVELGMLQMELTGRPDGARPHGFDSLLDYFESLLKDHEARNGSELDFQLTGEQCELLRQEAALYYQRYLSLFVLEEFKGVVQDTARNLRVLDMCGKYAENEQDRLVLEQYRPYITMMNTRAAASLMYGEKRYREAIAAIENGLASIREFFERFGQEQAYEQSHEVKVLKRFAREIRRKLPVDPKQRLQAQLQRAVKREDYELAARLRDEIQRMTQGDSPAPAKAS
jgi:hypothetical protein